MEEDRRMESGQKGEVEEGWRAEEGGRAGRESR
jgi:hypothetical protein